MLSAFLYLVENVVRVLQSVAPSKAIASNRFHPEQFASRNQSLLRAANGKKVAPDPMPQLTPTPGSKTGHWVRPLPGIKTGPEAQIYPHGGNQCASKINFADFQSMALNLELRPCADLHCNRGWCQHRTRNSNCSRSFGGQKPSLGKRPETAPKIPRKRIRR